MPTPKRSPTSAFRQKPATCRRTSTRRCRRLHRGSPTPMCGFTGYGKVKAGRWRGFKDGGLGHIDQFASVVEDLEAKQAASRAGGEAKAGASPQNRDSIPPALQERFQMDHSPDGDIIANDAANSAREKRRASSRASSRAYRERHPERASAIGKAWRARNPEREAQRARAREKAAASKRTWSVQNPEKVTAQKIAQCIPRPETCERCGEGGLIHRHHPDYTKPLHGAVPLPALSQGRASGNEKPCGRQFPQGHFFKDDKSKPA